METQPSEEQEAVEGGGELAITQLLIESAVATALALERTQAQSVQRISLEAAVREKEAQLNVLAAREIKQAVHDARVVALEEAEARAREEIEKACQLVRNEVREEEMAHRRLLVAGLEQDVETRVAAAVAAASQKAASEAVATRDEENASLTQRAIQIAVDEAIAKEKEEHARQIEAAVSSRLAEASARAALEGHTTARQEETTRRKQIVQEMMQSFAEERSKMEAAHAAALAKAQAETETSERQRREESEAHIKVLEGLQQSHTAALDGMEQAHATAMEELQQSHEAALEQQEQSLESKHAVAMEEMVAAALAAAAERQSTALQIVREERDAQVEFSHKKAVEHAMERAREEAFEQAEQAEAAKTKRMMDAYEAKVAMLEEKDKLREEEGAKSRMAIQSLEGQLKLLTQEREQWQTSAAVAEVVADSGGSSSEQDYLVKMKEQQVAFDKERQRLQEAAQEEKMRAVTAAVKNTLAVCNTSAGKEIAQRVLQQHMVEETSLAIVATNVAAPQQAASSPRPGSVPVVDMGGVIAQPRQADTASEASSTPAWLLGDDRETPHARTEAAAASLRGGKPAELANLSDDEFRVPPRTTERRSRGANSSTGDCCETESNATLTLPVSKNGRPSDASEVGSVPSEALSPRRASRGASRRAKQRDGEEDDSEGDADEGDKETLVMAGKIAKERPQLQRGELPRRSRRAAAQRRAKAAAEEEGFFAAAWKSLGF